jgi:uroporphyrinogen-III synthase
MRAFISRDLSPDSAFRAALAARGWAVSGQSLVVLAALPFEAVPDCDWLFFSSQHAVRFFFQTVENQGITIPRAAQGAVRWAALGPATAHALAQQSVAADFVGTGDPMATAARFRAQCAPSAGALPRILFPAARHARQGLRAQLAADFECIPLEIYDNRPLAEFPARSEEVLVFTSPMNAEAYFSKYQLLDNQCVVAIGATTAAALRGLGLQVVATAAEPNERALAEAVLALDNWH